jgi:pyruvate formate lyase activating enzyme
MKTLIVNIKRNSLDDGPGIRTVIFFKGCPLSCVWCQNPETKTASQEISFEKQNCLKCKECIEECKLGAIDFSNKYRINRELCILCGECINVCKGEALSFIGKEYSTDELITIILKDKPFYDNSGGGITLTGGEPTFHMEYLHDLLKKIKENNIHVCLETCGYYNHETFKKLILPYVDLIYFDLKILLDEMHKRYCRVSNEIIKNNFEELIKQQQVEILPRIPLIPKVTATEYNLTDFARYLKSLNITEIGLLPYNPLWLSKNDVIGVTSEYKRSKWMTQKEKFKVKSIFSEFKFRDF